MLNAWQQLVKKCEKDRPDVTLTLHGAGGTAGCAVVSFAPHRKTDAFFLYVDPDEEYTKRREVLAALADKASWFIERYGKSD